MKVIVTITADSHPELAAALAGMAPRQRAERLRLLATVGWVITQGRHTVTPALSLSEPTASVGLVAVAVGRETTDRVISFGRQLLAED